jgi:hypothetical protein
MCKWHKLAGSYRSPLLLDPLSPESQLAVSLLDKRDVLARNLLQNSSVAADIPLDTLTIPSIALPFPLVQDSNVERAILQAGNTVPRADKILTCILQAAWLLIKSTVC